MQSLGLRMQFVADTLNLFRASVLGAVARHPLCEARAEAGVAVEKALRQIVRKIQSSLQM